MSLYINNRLLNTPLKIAIYSGKIPSTTFIERLISGLAQKGITIYLFGKQESKINSNSKIKYITYSNKFSKLLQLIKYSILLTLLKAKDKKRLDAIINRNKNSRLLKVKYYPVLYHSPDIFHIQWAKSVEDWIWVKEFGIKLIVSLRGAHVNYSPIVDSDLANSYKTLFPKVDGFHSVSKAIADEALKYNARPNKIQIVYSGLNLKNISFQLKKTKAKNVLNIVSIGRGHWKKGYTYALNSMELLKARGIKFHYTMVGIENDEELLFQRKQLGLKSEISFIKKLPFEEVLKTIQLADVLLLPSVEEGIANVVLESMALGTIIVSTDCGGMSEVLKDNENGFLIPVRNSISMASALLKVSELSIESYHKITIEARYFVEKQHNAKKMIDDMNTLYQNVLNNRI